MAEKFKPQQGKIFIFPNTNKKGEKHPDAKGSANINGSVFEIAVWKSKGKNGEYYSGNISLAKEDDEHPE